jgi:hypothetical protein
MNTFLKGVAVLAVVASPVFAQSPNSPTNAQNPARSAPDQSVKPGEPGYNAMTAQKIRQDLQSAGFTDVQVVAESFVVKAKSKDGDPVVMMIGPRGMSVFEAMGTGSNSTTSGTTGSRTSNPINPNQAR